MQGKSDYDTTSHRRSEGQAMSQHTELIARLRNTPNWQRESYGDWKNGTLFYDRAPFEAADALEAIDALQAIEPKGLERVPMTEEADELLRKWNLDPDLYRTDSGALNHMKIAAALKHPDDYPHTAQTEAALSEVVRLSEDAGLYDEKRPVYDKLPDGCCHKTVITRCKDCPF